MYAQLSASSSEALMHDVAFDDTANLSSTAAPKLWGPMPMQERPIIPPSELTSPQSYCRSDTDTPLALAESGTKSCATLPSSVSVVPTPCVNVWVCAASDKSCTASTMPLRSAGFATATERNGKVTPLVPAKFYELLPKLKSSNFDYIIFDMPPIKQTSATVALSGLMDKVLLVVEPGKTNRAAIKRATDLMREQHADVAGVVNRLPKSAAKWLEPDLA